MQAWQGKKAEAETEIWVELSKTSFQQAALDYYPVLQYQRTQHFWDYCSTRPNGRKICGWYWNYLNDLNN